MIFHRGQRYLRLKTDGYIYPYTEALAKQSKMVEFFPFKADPPEEIVENERNDEELKIKLDLMTKREINKMAGLEKTERELQLTRKPDMIDQAFKKLTWR